MSSFEDRMRLREQVPIGINYGDKLNDKLIDVSKNQDTSGTVPEYPIYDENVDPEKIDDNDKPSNLLANFIDYLDTTDNFKGAKAFLTNPVWGVPNAYGLADNIDPTYGQAFYSGATQGLFSDPIMDKEDRIEAKKLAGLFTEDTMTEEHIKSGFFAVGELLQFAGVMKGSTAAAGVTTNALIMQNIINKGNRLFSKSTTSTIANLIPGQTARRNFIGVAKDVTAGIKVAAAFALETGIWKALNHSWIDGVLYAGGFPLVFNSYLVPGIKTAWKGGSGYVKTKLGRKGEYTAPQTTADGTIIPLQNIKQVLNLTKKEIEEAKAALPKNDGRQNLFAELELLNQNDKAVLQEINVLIKGLETDTTTLLNNYNKELIGLLSGLTEQEIKVLSGKTIAGAGNRAQKIAEKIQAVHKQRTKEFFNEAFDGIDNILNKFVDESILSLNSKSMKFDAATLKLMEKEIIGGLEQFLQKDANPVLRNIFSIGKGSSKGVNPYATFETFKKQIERKIKHKIASKGVATQGSWFRNIGVNAKNTDAENLGIVKKTVRNIIRSGQHVFNSKTVTGLETLGTVIKQIKPKIIKEPRGINYNRKSKRYERTVQANVVAVPKKALDSILNMSDKELYALGRDFNLSLTQVSRAIKDLQKHVKESTLEGRTLGQMQFFKLKREKGMYYFSGKHGGMQIASLLNTINKFTKTKMYKNITKEGTENYIARRVYNKGASLGRQSKLNVTQRTLAGGKVPEAVEQRAIDVARGEAKAFLTNLVDRATLAYYGLSPKNLVNMTKRLNKRKAEISGLDEKFTKSFYEIQSKLTPGKNVGPKAKIERLEEIFAGLKDKTRVLGKHLDIFQKIGDMNKAVKMVSEYNSTNATLNGAKGFEVFSKDLTAILKKVDGVKRTSEKADLAVQREYYKFMNNYNKHVDGGHVIVDDIDDAIIGLIESTGVKNDVMVRALPAVFKALNNFVREDMAVLYGKLAKRIDTGGKEFAETYRPLVQNLQSLLSKNKTADAERLLAETLIGDRKLQKFLVKDNSDFGNLLLLYKALKQPEFRNILKETILRNKNHTTMVEILEKINRGANPKFFMDLPTTGANIQAMSAMLNESHLAGPGGIFGRIGSYFFTEQHKIAQKSGAEELVALNTLISDAIQKLQRMTSKGGALDLDVVNYEKSLQKVLTQVNKGRAATEKITSKDIDDIIVALDKLETEAGSKLSKSVDYTKMKADILEKLPVEVRQLLDDFYDLTWKYAELYNNEVKKLQALIKTGNVFDDTGTAIPWRKGMEDEFQLIERKNSYFPRFTERQNQETYEIFLQKIDANGKKGPVIRMGDTQKSLENVHKQIQRQVENTTLKEGENVVYSFKINQPLGSMFQSEAKTVPKSRTALLLDDMDSMTSLDHRTIRKHLDEGTFSRERFYHEAFVAGPSMAKKRYNVGTNYETNHINALQIYLSRIARHTTMLESVAKSDSLLAHYYKTPQVIPDALAKSGITSMKDYIPYVSSLIDEALGRPSSSTKLVNKVMNELVNRGTKIAGVNTNTNFDVRKLVNFNNTYNYYGQFGANIMSAFVQYQMFLTSVLPSLGKYGINGLLNGKAIKFARDAGRYNTMMSKASDLPNIKSIKSKHEKYFAKMKKENPELYAEIQDIHELYRHNNLNIDSSSALLLADTHVADIGSRGTGVIPWISKNYHQFGNFITKPFRKGDETPRKIAILAAYRSGDEVFTSVIKKLNTLGINWQTQAYQSKKIISMIRQTKGMRTLNPLEEAAMELIINSSKRNFLPKGRTTFYSKKSGGTTYDYKTSREFKKDLATRFQEKTNHLYNTANNTGFMNNQLLKSYNLYKKFAVKEFGRLTGLARGGDYATLMGSLLGYGTIAGGIGLPFARDMLALYSWAYRSTAGVFGVERGQVSKGLIDPEYTLRASGDGWLKNLVGFGVASTMGIDLSQNGSVGMASYFDKRGTGFAYGDSDFARAADYGLNIALGDTYIRLGKFYRGLMHGPKQVEASAMVEGTEEAYADVDTKKNIRILEAVGHMVPGSKHVLNTVSSIYGLGPLNYKGQASDVYNVMSRDNDNKLDAGYLTTKALGFKTMDETLFEMHKSGLREHRYKEALKARQDVGIDEILSLEFKINELAINKPEGYEDDIEMLKEEQDEIGTNLQISQEQVEAEAIKRGIEKGRLITEPGNILEKERVIDLIEQGKIDPGTGRFIKKGEKTTDKTDEISGSIYLD